MNFWTTFAINEALSVAVAFLASQKTSLTPAQVQALETYIAQTQTLLTSF